MKSIVSGFAIPLKLISVNIKYTQSVLVVSVVAALGAAVVVVVVVVVRPPPGPRGLCASQSPFQDF